MLISPRVFLGGEIDSEQLSTGGQTEEKNPRLFPPREPVAEFRFERRPVDGRCRSVDTDV